MRDGSLIFSAFFPDKKSITLPHKTSREPREIYGFKMSGLVDAMRVLTDSSIARDTLMTSRFSGHIFAILRLSSDSSPSFTFGNFFPTSSL